MDGQQNAPQQPEEPTWQFKPGETISPRSQSAASVAPQEVPAPSAAQSTPSEIQYAAPEPAPAPLPAANPQPAESTPLTFEQQPIVPQPANSMPAAVPQQQPLPQAQQTPVENSGYGSAEPQAYAAPATTYDSITWTASEFVAYHKTAGWHALLVVGSIVMAIVVWALFRDVISSIVVIAGGIMLSYYGSRRPQQLQYQLGPEGLYIGQKHYNFTDFRSFSIIPEDAFSSIALMPTKRFAPLTSLYYAPDDEDQIVGILGEHLPHQERKPDALEALMRRIRF